MSAKFLSKWIVAAGLSAFPVLGSAADHPHDKGPHGGLVGGFGDKNHMEALRSGDKVTFYVLGEDGKSAASVAKTTGGDITLIAPGKPVAKTAIPAAAAFSEMAVPAPAKGAFTALVKILADGKTITAKFNLKD